MAEFKMAAIIKLSQNEWVLVRLTSMSQSFFCKMDESKMAEFKMAAIIKLSENEWVWVRLNQFESESGMEWECFWVNLREDNKSSDSKMAVSDPTWQNSRWLPSSSWVRMNQWSFFVQNGLIMMAEFKMAAIIKLSQNEWDLVRLN